MLRPADALVDEACRAGGDRIEQVLDSYNFTGNRPVTCLMAPLGFHLTKIGYLPHNELAAVSTPANMADKS